MTHVLLLRSPQESADKYELAFRSSGFIPYSIPVLETVLVNHSMLKDIVRAGPQVKGYDGVIVTSARACEAWGSAVQSLDRDGIYTDDGWTKTPFYVVGAATAKTLADIASHAKHSLLDIRGASESGTGERLAHFILADRSRSSSALPGGSNTYLYLTGDKNRETLPNVLSAGGAKLESIMVYETTGSSKFSNDLSYCISSLPPAVRNWWIVYFAPSAAEFVTPIIRAHLSPPSAGNSTAESASPHLPLSPEVRTAVIGPTTAAFLHDSLGIHVDVVAPKPTPESLVLAINAFEEADIASAAPIL